MHGLLLPVDKTYIVSQVLETLCYGFFVCVFVLSIYTYTHSGRNTHANIMFAITCIMFFIATWHFAITFYRTVEGVTDLQGLLLQGGAEFLENSKLWHALMRNILYIVQVLLGDAVAIYRCWVLWDRGLRAISIPLIFFVGTIVSGIMACVNLSSVVPLKGGSTRDWVAVFYALGVTQNALTTTLMVFRLYRSGRPKPSWPLFSKTILLLFESAAFYFVLQIVILAFFLARSNFQAVLLGMIPPIIGATFTGITIRVAIRAQQLQPTIAGLTSQCQWRADGRNLAVAVHVVSETTYVSSPGELSLSKQSELDFGVNDDASV
ncbi:hypothetical protein FB45DRAFT_1102719 [Roridomyces roridus]|uniref:Uncharacterized protein n=1 Tax=Roridomyces roridus TaxID=1738132 RepID=A0AAD7FZV2_9AGAR|nr:hypothetical protein FB45DRAFT_1102719 [Roridomyces roridus]